MSDDRSEARAREVARWFGLGAVRSVERVGGNANANYRVEADQGAFLVKLVLEHRRANVEAELAYVERLGAHGVPVVAFEASPGGERVYEDAHGVAVVQRWREGVMPAEDAPEAVFAQIGCALARVHGVPYGSLPTRRSWLERDFVRATVAELEAEGVSKAALAPFRAVAGLDAQVHGVGLPRAIMHGDLHTGNCLVQADGGAGVVALLDWEEAAVGPAVLDLAMSVVGVAVADDGRVYPREASALVRGYVSVRPLSWAELRVWVAALRYAYGVLGVWRARQHAMRDDASAASPNATTQARGDAGLKWLGRRLWPGCAWARLRR